MLLDADRVRADRGAHVGDRRECLPGRLGAAGPGPETGHPRRRPRAPARPGVRRPAAGLSPRPLSPASGVLLPLGRRWRSGCTATAGMRRWSSGRPGFRTGGQNADVRGRGARCCAVRGWKESSGRRPPEDGAPGSSTSAARPYGVRKRREITSMIRVNRTREGGAPLPRGRRTSDAAPSQNRRSGYLTSSPVIVRPISIRWILLVPSKILKILAEGAVSAGQWPA
jgi:hypothetical protein